MAEVKYVIFRLCDQRYSMKLSQINGIEHVYSIVPIPMGAPCIKGIIHLRNNVLPVYSLKEKFGLEENEKETNKQLLVTESHGLALAFEVDDVLGIVPVDESEINEAPQVVQNEETVYLENVVRATLPEEKKSTITLSISVDNIMTDGQFGDVSRAVEKIKTDAE